MPRAKAHDSIPDEAIDQGGLVLVSKLAKDMNRYVLKIDESQKDEDPHVVPVINGDYQVNVVRGHYWIVAEAIVTVLRDASGDKVDFQGRITGKYRSYPFTAVVAPDQTVPLGTLVDEEGQPTQLEAARYVA